jgi:hypothetical protein
LFVLIDPRFQDLDIYHTDLFIPNALLIAEQQLRGILVDRSQLSQYRAELCDKLDTLRGEFIKLPQVAPHIEDYENTLYKEYKQATPKGKLDIAHDRFRFNIQSKQQLEWLLFDRLGYEPVKETGTGRRSVDKKSLPSFGDVGRVLLDYNKTLKELGYVKACLELTESDSILHPKMKYPGTLTGRASSGGS